MAGETPGPRPEEIDPGIDPDEIIDTIEVSENEDDAIDIESDEVFAAEADSRAEIRESLDPVELERMANDKIQETAFGKELLLGDGESPGALDSLRDSVDSQRPRGAWEKFKYFVGADKRAEGYNENRGKLKKAERALGEWQKAEVEQLRQGEQFADLQELKLNELANSESIREQVSNIENQINELRQDLAPDSEGQEEIISEIQQLEAQRLEAIDALRKSERMAKHYEKSELKLALRGHKDRLVLEEKILPELAQMTGVSSEVPIEGGAGRLYDSQEAIDDYTQKNTILNTLNKILSEPNSEEAKYLVKILQGKIAGAEDEDGSPGVHAVAKMILPMLQAQPGVLDDRHQEEYIKKEIGKSIRIAAEAVKVKLLVEGAANSKIAEMSEDLKKYNPRSALDLLDKKIIAEKHEKACKIGIKKARKGYVTKQLWDNYVRKNIKEGAKSAFGVEEGADVQYDTRLRDILKDGSNMLAVVTQGSGFLPAVLNPARLGTLTKATETIEGIISWPLSKTFKRSVAINKWRTSLTERRNNTSVRIADGVDAILRVSNDMDAIRRRRSARLGTENQQGQVNPGAANA